MLRNNIFVILFILLTLKLSHQNEPFVSWATYSEQNATRVGELCSVMGVMVVVSNLNYTVLSSLHRIILRFSLISVIQGPIMKF